MTGIMVHTQHLPPSVNECYANNKGAGKGRYRTDRYRRWANAAGWDFNGKGQVGGAFTVAITIDRKLRHGSADIDNRIKPVLDMLQEHQIIENDRLCECVTARWGDADGGMVVHILPYANARAA